MKYLCSIRGYPTVEAKVIELSSDKLEMYARAYLRSICREDIFHFHNSNSILLKVEIRKNKDPDSDPIDIIKFRPVLTWDLILS